ncbi:MAG: hypothetical protein SCK28_07945 [Bacillota bacterium]|nr:hypothetical protein [Bacillota bacterium]
MKKYLVILLTVLAIVTLAGCSSSTPEADSSSKETSPEAEVAQVVEEFIQVRHNYQYETYTGAEGFAEYLEESLGSSLAASAEVFANNSKEFKASKKVIEVGEVEVTMIDENKASASTNFSVEWTRDGVTETVNHNLSVTLEKVEDKWLISLLNGNI